MCDGSSEAMVEVQRTWEGAHADVAVRPLGVDEDLWLPVQVKSCKEQNSNGCWHFNWVHKYPGMPGPASLAHKLLLAYEDTFFAKDSLDNIILQRSETSQKGEASIAAWAPLLSAAGVEVHQELIYEMTPVDAIWWWNGKRFLIQHKTAILHHVNNGSHLVILQKSAGNKATQLYDEADFDLLAASLPENHHFYLFPMAVLVQRRLVNGHRERRQCTGSAVMLWTREAEAMQRLKEAKRCRGGGRADFWANEYLIDTHAADGGVGRLHAILESAGYST
ncbi:unnamed protein product [Vitrella brassicaformis CCMP3155]|uniref:Uncharacterized protein n=1 Tax=Vitrella brassicaformis (strain CCMP3155) TaxID=1169540 RepID=A0A0G4GGL0_VITBC|nr:unnamed protein product [Vitrella brassicaformis CCMP3155]|eukprot:CEM28774.1 unnamed protein product [Vitrella brassicaformis CCMP3155]